MTVSRTRDLVQKTSEAIEYFLSQNIPPGRQEIEEYRKSASLWRSESANLCADEKLCVEDYLCRLEDLLGTIPIADVKQKAKSARQKTVAKSTPQKTKPVSEINQAKQEIVINSPINKKAWNLEDVCRTKPPSAIPSESFLGTFSENNHEQPVSAGIESFSLPRICLNPRASLPAAASWYHWGSSHRWKIVLAGVIGAGIVAAATCDVPSRLAQGYDGIKQALVSDSNYYLYFVKPGDSLSKISQNLSGDLRRYPELQLANNLPNTRLAVHQVLAIPRGFAKNSSGLTKAKIVGTMEDPSQSKLPLRYHITRANDTLESISKCYSAGEDFADIILAFNRMYNPSFNPDLKSGYHMLIPPMVPKEIGWNQYKDYPPCVSMTLKNDSSFVDISVYISGTSIYAMNIFNYNRVHDSGFTDVLKAGQTVFLPPLVPAWKPE